MPYFPTDFAAWIEIQKRWESLNLAGSDDNFKSWPSGNMTNHFLSDVCFGVLITYLIYSFISTAFLRVKGE